jgi:hypothetical protein
MERPGPDGPAQIYLTVARYGNEDGFWLRAWNPDTRRLQDVARVEKGLPPDSPHHVALQVRGGQLNLFIDGKRVATTPFQPAEPLQAISFFFGSRGGHELPYKDRPALMDYVRIAGYSRPVGRASGGVFLYWLFPGNPQNLPQLQAAQSQTFGSSAMLDFVGGERRTVEGTLVVIDLPANPFAPDEVRVRASGQAWQEFVHRLKADSEVVRERGGGLVIVGDGGDGRTERERRLLANLRALAFAAWLAQQGIGNPQNQLSIVADNGSYESIYYAPGSGEYAGVQSLQMERGR